MINIENVWRFRDFLSDNYPEVKLTTFVTSNSQNTVKTPIKVTLENCDETTKAIIRNEFARREIYFELAERQFQHEPGGEDGEESERDIKFIGDKHGLSDEEMRKLIAEGSEDNWQIPQYDLEKSIEVKINVEN